MAISGNNPGCQFGHRLKKLFSPLKRIELPSLVIANAIKQSGVLRNQKILVITYFSAHFFRGLAYVNNSLKDDP